jgi:mycothiol synthase
MGVFTLITHPKAGSDQAERALLGLCQHLMDERMRENPADKRSLVINVAATNQQRIDLLRSLGYQPEPPKYVTTIKSLAKPLSKPPLPEGFTLRSVAAESEAGLLAEVHNRSFGSSWTEAEYLKVMRTPGFKIEHELVAVAPDGRLAAFVIYWLDPISRSG